MALELEWRWKIRQTPTHTQLATPTHITSSHLNSSALSQPHRLPPSARGLVRSASPCRPRPAYALVLSPARLALECSPRVKSSELPSSVRPSRAGLAACHSPRAYAGPSRPATASTQGQADSARCSETEFRFGGLVWMSALSSPRASRASHLIDPGLVLGPRERAPATASPVDSLGLLSRVPDPRYSLSFPRPTSSRHGHAASGPCQCPHHRGAGQGPRDAHR